MLASSFSPYGIQAQIPITRRLTLIQPARETTRTVTLSVSHVQRLFAVIDVPHNFELFHSTSRICLQEGPHKRNFIFSTFTSLFQSYTRVQGWVSPVNSRSSKEKRRQ